jgi:thiamine biosynthesis lipoprotein
MRLSLNYRDVAPRLPAPGPLILAAALAGLSAGLLREPEAAARGGATVAGAGAAAARTEAAPAARARHLMGTRLTIEVVGGASEETFAAAFDEVARLEEVMSNWRGTSEVSRLNREAAKGWVACSADLFKALEAALTWAETTQGAFDPTVEPLVRMLGLRGDEGRLPGAPAAPADGPGGPVGWRHVRLDRARRAARFDAPGVGIDLGGIGKGLALDAAARLLRRRGVTAALLDFGGQVLAIGSPPGGRGFPVGLADPAERERPAAVVRLCCGSLATSGNGKRGAPGPGGSGGHVLDPALGAPARFAGSVTVLAPDATAADALSTALLVMGPESGAPWAAARGVEAAFLWRDAGGVLRHRATGWFERQLGEEHHGRGAVPPR